MRTSFHHQSEAQPPNGPLTAVTSPDTPSAAQQASPVSNVSHMKVHAAGTRRVSAAGLAPPSGEIVTQIQLGGSSTDSLVRILHAQPRSWSPSAVLSGCRATSLSKDYAMRFLRRFSAARIGPTSGPVGT